MKRIYFIAISLIAMLTMFSCKDKEEKEINLDINVENLSGQWEETKVSINNQTYDVVGSTYTFKADGTYEYKGLEEEYGGTWKLKDKQLLVYKEDASGKETTYYGVDKLTNLTLVLAWEVEETKYVNTYKRK